MIKANGAIGELPTAGLIIEVGRDCIAYMQGLIGLHDMSVVGNQFHAVTPGIGKQIRDVEIGGREQRIVRKARRIKFKDVPDIGHPHLCGVEKIRGVAVTEMIEHKIGDRCRVHRYISCAGKQATTGKQKQKAKYDVSLFHSGEVNDDSNVVLFGPLAGFVCFFVEAQADVQVHRNGIHVA